MSVASGVPPITTTYRLDGDVGRWWSQVKPGPGHHLYRKKERLERVKNPYIESPSLYVMQFDTGYAPYQMNRKIKLRILW
jgi:hypothetical protein